MIHQTWFDKAAGFFLVRNPLAHWGYQRITAIAMIPSSIWLLVLMHKLRLANHAETLDWLSQPINSLVVTAWIAAALYHAALGMQVVVEDYVHTTEIRHWLIRMLNLIFLILGLLALLAMIVILL